MQIHFGWILLTAVVLIIILTLFLIRKRKTASNESNFQQGEISTFLSINKHERKEGVKHIVIKNSGKGRANHCRIENA